MVQVMERTRTDLTQVVNDGKHHSRHSQDRTDLRQVDLRLALTDDVVGDLPIRIHCTRHSDTDPSLCVYPDHLHCFSVGCGFHIQKRLDALAWLLELGSWRDALRVAHKYTNHGLEAYRQRVEMESRMKPLPVAQAKLYHKLAYKERRGGYVPVQWYYERGLTDDTIERFTLGHDGLRFTVPIFGADGQLLNIRYRLDETYTDETNYSDGKLVKKYSGIPGRNGAYLYPEWLIPDDVEELFICEGELDAVRLHQEGYDAITSTNGAGNLLNLLHKIVELFQSGEKYGRLKTLSIITDMDEAGDFVGKELLEEAQKYRSSFETRRIVWNPAWGKDVTELYKSGHSLENTIPVTLRFRVSDRG